MFVKLVLGAFFIMFVNYCQLKRGARKNGQSGDYFLDDLHVPGTFRRVENQRVTPVGPGKMKRNSPFHDSQGTDSGGE
jgi:hypothetical protein